MKEKYGAVFKEGTKYEIAQPTGEYAHKNFPGMEHAVDFIIPVDTEIVAVKGGKIVDAKSDSDKHGLDGKFRNEANYVIVKHDDGTYGEYVHLGKDKVTVEKGQKVKKGDLLGYSGLSGQMDKPHLHLNMLREEDGKYIGIHYANELSELKEGDRKSSGGGLEKIAATIFIVSIGMALISFSGITGNVVGIANNGFYGMVPLGVGLLSGGIWIFLRKKI